MRRATAFQLSFVAGLIGVATACDYDGFELYPQVTDVPGIIDLDAELGGIVPSAFTDRASFEAAVHYGAVGATGTSELGGTTFTFKGTGGSVCLWVDPEVAFWNQSVASTAPEQAFEWPDNQTDDGDIDLFAGYSVYYSGSPGQEIGNFNIVYEDALGNTIPIDFNECRISGYQPGDNDSHMGRGRPEFCTLSATQPDVDYTVLMQTWSTPTDDDILSYGFAVVQGRCTDVQRLADDSECVIAGEGRDPATNLPYPGSDVFEEAFCSSVKDNNSTALFDYCEAESSDKDCASEHCFCGDALDSPIAQ
jgi:hypothetical protein